MSPSLERYLTTLCACCGAALVASAQSSRPNFSGTWVMNHERSVLQISSPDSTIFVIRHADPAFTIFRTHFSGAQRDTITIALRTDSTEQTRMLGDVTWSSRAWWNGDTLVFWSNLSRGDKKGLNVVRYSLSSDAATFTALEHFASPMATHDNVWVFDRRP